jgi:hypothetical protein
VRKPGASQRKERVTVTLSPNSVAFVRKYSATERIHVSTALESMIEDFRRTKELEQLNANVASFYDSLPDPIVQEQAAWGTVGAAGLAEMFEPETQADLQEQLGALETK